MKKVLLLMLLLAAVLLAACGSTEEEGELTVKFTDLMELKGKFGATAAELGIQEDFMFTYTAKGNFFGQNCSCCLGFDGDKVLTDYSIYVHEDPNEMFTDLYSGPVSANMTPYVESNGGAVYTYVYEDKDALISVSKADKRADYHVVFKPNPNPGFFGTLTLKPADDDGSFPKKTEAKPAGYDNGILTVRVTNRGESPLELSDEFMLFERGDSAYYSKPPMLFRNADTYTVLPGETADISLDLRIFGKVTPNGYMVEFSGIELYFVLEDSSVSEGGTP